MSMKLGARLVAAAGVGALLFYVGFGIQTVGTLKDDDLVTVNSNMLIYASIPCDFAHITEAYAPDANPFDRYDERKVMKLSEARSMGARPDAICRSAKGFEFGHSSLSADLWGGARGLVTKIFW
jgi:hypothetical protein